MDGTDAILDVESLGEAVAELVDRVQEGETAILVREGRAMAAMISIATLESWQAERELLRRLAVGELECAGEDGDELAAVLEDCRLLLGES